MRTAERLVGVSVGVSLGLTGCVSGESYDEPLRPGETQCIATDIAGNGIIPLGYPEGQVAVSYDAQKYEDSIYVTPVETIGEIVKTEAGYQLAIRMGSETILAYTRAITDAVIDINTLETGYLGFSRACLEFGQNEYGFETTYVNLPVAEQTPAPTQTPAEAHITTPKK